MYFEFMNKTKLCAGENALSQLDYECQQYHMTHPMILTDAVLYQLKYVDILTKHLSINYHVYTDIPVDSSIHTIEDIKKEYEKNHCDGLIALGGGSVLDTAKGVYLMLSQECDNIDDILGFEDLKVGKDIPFFAIPTTSGTGSEATCVAVVSHPERQVKLEIISQHIQSQVAFIDPVFTQNLPLKTTASTGIDALTHAIEAYVSTAATPVTDACAQKAIELISDYLRDAVADGNNMEARDKMAYAEFLAGMAFNNASLGYVHAIAHQYGGFYNLPHGVCNAILLPAVQEFNAKVAAKQLKDCAKFMGVDVSGMSDDEGAAACIAAIRKLSVDVNIPKGFADLGAKEEDFDILATNALKDACGATNPIQATHDEIKAILAQVM